MEKLPLPTGPALCECAERAADCRAHQRLRSRPNSAEREPHLAFGHGTHYCLGAYLARAEMVEALPILAKAMPDLALGGDPVYRPELSGFVGPVILPLTFTPTSA